MDEFVFNSIDRYFNTLSKLGYMKTTDVYSLIVLLFYFRFAFRDYRGYIKRDDYLLIEKALNCLYGKNCLIPYPLYARMGDLKLGEMTEVLSRTKALEEYSKELDARVTENREIIDATTLELDEHGTRLNVIEQTKVIKGKTQVRSIPDIDLTSNE